MPKSRDQRVPLGGKSGGRANQVDLRRLELLDQLLEESSSASLNDFPSLQSPKQALESHSRLFDIIAELKTVEAPYHRRLTARTDENWSLFFSWVEQELSAESNPSYLSTKLGINITKLSGAGTTNQSSDCVLVAKVPFKKGEDIFSIGRKIMLSTETISRDIDLHEFVKRDSIASGMQNVVLVLHLLNEFSKGEKSYWHRYLSILPNWILPVLSLDKASFSHLAASAHIFDALRMVRAISRQYSYFFKRLQSTNLPLSRNFTFEYYCWGVSMVCSRQNEIPSQRHSNLSPVTHALIPVLDMCNHDRSSDQATFERNHSCLRAFRDLEPGDEITINYGSRSSGDFYIHNGFIPDVVPYDIVPLTVGITKQDKLNGTKVELLKILNMPPSGRYKFTFNNHENRHKRDPHLTMFLIVNLLSEEEIDYLMDSSNPVGIADEIYEYVQYGKSDSDVKASVQSSAFGPEVISMKTRIRNAIKTYMYKRSAISIALIDRELDLMKENHTDLRQLLKNEKLLYESHVIKPDQSC